MDVNGLLDELLGRVTGHVHEIVADLDVDALTWAPGTGANPIGWQIWHLTRVQDSHVAELVDRAQVWASGPWAGRFGLEPDPADTGYGHSPEQVAAVRPDGPDALVAYYEAVADPTREYLRGLTPDDLDRIVDRNWDPPVTLGVRLVSIFDDSTQHAGQAAYVKGLLPHRT